jgi:hypothetical protein
MESRMTASGQGLEGRGGRRVGWSKKEKGPMDMDNGVMIAGERGA